MEDILKAKSGYIRTYSGKYIMLNSLEQKDICIEDIAHALAFKPRFNGNGKSWYSIARHSIAVSHLVPPRYKLIALLHDASEAYLFDIPAPAKRYPEFKDIVELEDKIQSLVYEKYCLPKDSNLISEIKTADFMELQREWSLTMMRGELSSNSKEDEKEFIRLFMMYSEYFFKSNTYMLKQHTENGTVAELKKLKKLFCITDDEIHFSTN